ncbi:18073_t:CDS:1, partial [Racocetra fulgida]
MVYQNQIDLNLSSVLYKLRIESLPIPNLFRALFLNNSEEKCEVPEEIKCKDLTNNIEIET